VNLSDFGGTLRQLLSKVRKRPMIQSAMYAMVSAAEAAQTQYPYIFVNHDGTVRELHASERQYLEQAFMPADGGRPYVKSTFDACDGCGSVKGFLHRSKIPDGLSVAPAPANNPNPPMSKADQIAFLKEKAVQFGLEVVDKSDGTVQVKRRTNK
jgi:hypothetical protein